MPLIIAVFLGGCGKFNKVEVVDKTLKGRMTEGTLNYLEKKYEKSESIYLEIQRNHPLSGEAVEVQLKLADTYYAMERFDDAEAYYTDFVSLHPSHPMAPYGLFQKGMSNFRKVLSIDRDQVATKKALFAFGDLVREYPESEYGERSLELIEYLTERLAEREFYIGAYYYKGKNYKGALRRFKDILEDYSGTGLKAKTLYYVGLSYVGLGEKDLASEAFMTLQKSYPDSPYALASVDDLNRIED